MLLAVGRAQAQQSTRVSRLAVRIARRRTFSRLRGPAAARARQTRTSSIRTERDTAQRRKRRRETEETDSTMEGRRSLTHHAPSLHEHLVVVAQRRAEDEARYAVEGDGLVRELSATRSQLKGGGREGQREKDDTIRFSPGNEHESGRISGRRPTARGAACCLPPNSVVSHALRPDSIGSRFSTLHDFKRTTLHKGPRRR